MAEEIEQKPPEPKPPEPKQEPAEDDANRPEPAYAECPECDALMRPEKLGGHRFKAHAVERRQVQEGTEGDDTGKQKREGGPPKNTPKPKPNGEEGTPQRKKSRWAEVGWGKGGD